MKTWKILVISDSHGQHDLVRFCVGMHMPIDMLIHCGDVEGDLDAVLGKGRDYDLYVVGGNMDRAWHYPEEELIRVGFYNIYVAHGHRHGTKYSNEQILEAGRKKLADVVLCGHSHVPEIVTTEDNILLVNPGSVALPHQDPPRKTCAVLTISEDSLPEAEIVYLPDHPVWR